MKPAFEVPDLLEAHWSAVQHSSSLGLSKAGKGKVAKTKGKYLFSVKAMSKVFRGRFISALKEQLPDQINVELLNRVDKHNRIVYAKRPFSGTQSVIE